MPVRFQGARLLQWEIYLWNRDEQNQQVLQNILVNTAPMLREDEIAFHSLNPNSGGMIQVHAVSGAESQLVKDALSQVEKLKNSLYWLASRLPGKDPGFDKMIDQACGTFGSLRSAIGEVIKQAAKKQAAKTTSGDDDSTR